MVASSFFLPVVHFYRLKIFFKNSYFFIIKKKDVDDNVWLLWIDTKIPDEYDNTGNGWGIIVFRRAYTGRMMKYLVNYWLFFRNFLCCIKKNILNRKYICEHARSLGKKILVATKFSKNFRNLSHDEYYTFAAKMIVVEVINVASFLSIEKTLRLEIKKFFGTPNFLY